MRPAIAIGTSRICAVLALGVTAALCCSARAQAGDDASTTAAARGLAVEGVKLAQAGRCDDAVDKLERAEALHHAPIVLGQLGECYIAQGKLVAGTELLRNVLREALPAAPSPALRKAYARAQVALDAAKPKIALLTIHVNAAAAEHASVSVDGQPVPPALLGAERPTDPGEHVIEGAAPGYRPARAQVTLSTGEAQSVALNLDVDPEALLSERASEVAASATMASAAEPAPAPLATQQRTATTTQRAQPNRTAAYVSWAVAGVALGMGAGFGIAAANGKSDLDAHCPGNVCTSDRADALDDAKRNGVIATVGLSLGAAAAVLGTVLFVLAGNDESATPNTQARAQRPAARLSLAATPAATRLALAF